MGSEKTIFELAAANVEPLDDGREKKLQEEQVLFMNRVPKAALASILCSWAYFGYSFKCLLDAQAGGLSGTSLKVAWLSFAMQLSHASQSTRRCLQHDPKSLTDYQFLLELRICWLSRQWEKLNRSRCYASLVTYVHLWTSLLHTVVKTLMC